MQLRRGQITIYVLVGLGILLLFIILLFVRKAFTTTNEPGIVETHESQRLKEYVEQCVDLVSEQGFLQLGNQGGLLFESQRRFSPKGSS